jgi:hypothetical protein
MMNGIKLFFFIILVISNLSCAEEKGPVIFKPEIYRAYRERFSEGKVFSACIVTDSNIFRKHDESILPIRRIKVGEIIDVIDRSEHGYFENGDIFFLYLIKRGNGEVGWIRSDVFCYPYSKNTKEIIGIREMIVKDELLGDKILKKYSSTLCLSLINIKLKKETNKGLSTYHVENGSIIAHRLIASTEVKVNELNGDNMPEIVVKGKYLEGLYETDNVVVFDSELWFNLNNKKLELVFINKDVGIFDSEKIWERKNLEIIDNNLDGFKEQINVIAETKMGDSGIYSYFWTGFLYQLKK